MSPVGINCLSHSGGLNKFWLHFISASYSDASYSSDEDDGVNPREKEQVTFYTFLLILPLLLPHGNSDSWSMISSFFFAYITKLDSSLFSKQFRTMSSHVKLCRTMENNQSGSDNFNFVLVTGVWPNIFSFYRAIQVDRVTSAWGTSSYQTLVGEKLI